jgi:hypothetical protein
VDPAPAGSSARSRTAGGRLMPCIEDECQVKGQRGWRALVCLMRSGDRRKQSVLGAACWSPGRQAFHSRKLLCNNILRYLRSGGVPSVACNAEDQRCASHFPCPWPLASEQVPPFARSLTVCDGIDRHAFSVAKQATCSGAIASSAALRNSKARRRHGRTGGRESLERAELTPTGQESSCAGSRPIAIREREPEKLS